MGLTVSPSLIGVHWILALDGAGLMVLSKPARAILLVLLGTAQMSVGLAGFALEVLVGWDLALWWLGLLFGLAACRLLLHWRLARQGFEIKQGHGLAGRFSLEIMLWFVVSSAVYYTLFEASYSPGQIGLLCWHLAFGTSAAIVWTLGGIGLMTTRAGVPLLYLCRGTVAFGTFWLIRGWLVA